MSVGPFLRVSTGCPGEDLPLAKPVRPGAHLTPILRVLPLSWPCRIGVPLGPCLEDAAISSRLYEYRPQTGKLLLKLYPGCAECRMQIMDKVVTSCRAAYGRAPSPASFRRPSLPCRCSHSRKKCVQPLGEIIQQPSLLFPALTKRNLPVSLGMTVLAIGSLLCFTATFLIAVLWVSDA